MNKSKLKWYEEEFEEINNLIKNKNSLSHYEFLRIRNFKLQTLTRECENQIQGITRKAFKLAEEDKIEEAIEKLIQMHGVGIPIASTILAMKFPEKYAIIDKRVIKNLRKEEWLKDYKTNPRTYHEYLVLMRKRAKDKGISLRCFERSLFEGVNNK